MNADSPEARLMKRLEGSPSAAYLNSVFSVLPDEKRSLLAAIIDTSIGSPDPPGWLVLATMSDLLGAVQAATIDLAHAGGSQAAPIKKAAQDIVELLNRVKDAANQVSSEAARTSKISADASQAVTTSLAAYRAALNIEKAQAVLAFESAVLRNRLSMRNTVLAVAALIAIALGIGTGLGYRSGWSVGEAFGVRDPVVHDAEVRMLRRVSNEAVRRHREDIANFIGSQIKALQ